MSSSMRPLIPPASLISSTAICLAWTATVPYVSPGPVRDSITPILRGGNGVGVLVDAGTDVAVGMASPQADTANAKTDSKPRKTIHVLGDTRMTTPPPRKRAWVHPAHLTRPRASAACLYRQLYHLEHRRCKRSQRERLARKRPP